VNIIWEDEIKKTLKQIIFQGSKKKGLESGCVWVWCHSEKIVIFHSLFSLFVVWFHSEKKVIGGQNLVTEELSFSLTF